MLTLGDYAGIWLDDVNMIPRITDGTTDASGNYNTVLPDKWTVSTWEINFANYVRLIRAALAQSAIIIHNALWVPNNAPIDSQTKQQIASCDFFYLERGISDSGLTGGVGPYSITNFFNFVDKVHSEGTPVIFGDYKVSTMEYSIAGFLMISEGSDMIGFADQPLAPPWPVLLSLNLGQSQGKRTQSGPLWSRKFALGEVYINEPGAAPITVTLKAPGYDINGNQISSFSLGPQQGKVIFYDKLAN